MAYYANQKTIKINRQKVDAKQPYLNVQKEVITAASKQLNGVPFKLYIYLLCNKDGFELGYSPQHFVNEWGVSIRAAHDAFGELLKCGYLIPTEGRNNHYSFFETPHPTKLSLSTSSPVYVLLIDENNNPIYRTKGELIETEGNTEAETLWTSAAATDGYFIKDKNGNYVKLGGDK